MSTPDAYTGVDNLEAMAEAQNYNEFLVRLIRCGARPGARTLDFGAGVGTFAEQLHDDLQITCVEADEGLQQLLRRKGLDAAGDMGDLPDESFDYVYSLNVLEHIDDDFSIVKEWHRLLKPGGAALVYVPAFRLLYGPMDRKVGHVRRYSRIELRTILNRAGFEVERLEYADSLGYPASLVAKVVGTDDGTLDPKLVRLYDRAVFPVSRALDTVARRVAGKNVWALARKP
jgi:ubiquinone/menaquinone biosynthesis C-methylase UbiE